MKKRRKTKLIHDCKGKRLGGGEMFTFGVESSEAPRVATHSYS